MKTRTIIGLEIHVQLATRSKLFCGCPVCTDAPPNACVCAVCLGHPGSLPVMNRKAFEFAVVTGLALHCEIAAHTKWDRKSYYYPDLPKNYQISQYDLPIAQNGFFEIGGASERRRVRIRRAHLEEDAGKNVHDTPGCTLVDLNRTGTPLLEIVTEPDLSSADETYEFCVELHRLVTWLGVSDGNMQKGQMRFEPNVNVVIETDAGEVRTPISEIKNLNSFRHVRDAIAYEERRQVEAWKLDRGYRIGERPNENRGWDPDRGVTEFQRGKEAAHDYRYFPDPDLVPAEISPSMLDRFRNALPELPVARRQRWVERHGIALKDAETLSADRGTADLFERVVELGAPAEVAAKQFVNAWLRFANDRGVAVTELGIGAERMAELARITADSTVNKSAANQIAEVMLTRPDAPRTLAEELGLLQVQDTGETEAWVDQALAANPQAVQDALANPKKTQAAIGFLRGQVMRIAAGKADPKLVGELLERKLNDRKASA